MFEMFEIQLSNNVDYKNIVIQFHENIMNRIHPMESPNHPFLGRKSHNKSSTL